MPRPLRLLALSLLVAAPLAAQKPAANDPIVAANKVFGAAMAKGDAAAVAALYTADGQLLPPDAPVQAGTKAIEAFWAGAIKAGVKGLKLETLEVQYAGDVAHEVGAATIYGANNAVLEQGKYIVLWKKVGGAWKLHRDIWNANAPMAAAAPAKK
ncbi:MAG: SgcJ/EcaC family oxidoreductase [Gemmatimonadales bacterium]|nr:SgcJ/EcaC family oxidoreductase [Gemmatimonadales bacterium]